MNTPSGKVKIIITIDTKRFWVVGIQIICPFKCEIFRLKMFSGLNGSFDGSDGGGGKPNEQDFQKGAQPEGRYGYGPLP